jgi:PAS domain S-box-containing protein
MMKSLHLLLIENSPEDTDLLVHTLRQGGYEPDFERVETEEALRAALASRRWELILSNYELPSFSAPRALDVLKQTGKDIPFIVVAGAVGESTAVGMLKAGAQDFLLKAELPRLVPTLERELQEAEARQARRDAERKLRESTERLKTVHAIDRAILTQQPVAVMANLALDYFIVQHAVWAAALIVFNYETHHAEMHVVFHDEAVERLSGASVPLPDIAAEELDTLMKGGVYPVEIIPALLRPAFAAWKKTAPERTISASSPLLVEGILLGSLHLLTDEPDRIGPLALESLREIADQIAIGIQQRALQEKVARYTQDLEERVLERTKAFVDSERRYQLLADNAQDIVFRVIVQPTPQLEYVNPAVQTILGYTPEECYAGVWIVAGWLHPDDQSMLQVMAEAGTNISTTLRLRWLHKDGSIIWLEQHNVYVRDADGNIVAIEGIARDVTKQEQAEFELQQALAKQIDLNEQKNRFVSMVSHDFRTPLSVIQSSAGIMERYSDRLNDSQRAAHFEKINSQIRRMIGLLDDVLTITRADSSANHLALAVVDLDRLCQGIADDFQNTIDTQHQLNYRCTSENNLVTVDERMLVQAIVNLVSNAHKYSPEGTTVQFSLQVDAENAVITVSDSGIGIPEADQHQLFEAFNRASNVGAIQGTGLGLAIVKRVVEAHHGTIAIASQVGIGTTFTVTLPTAPIERHLPEALGA